MRQLKLVVLSVVMGLLGCLLGTGCVPYSPPTAYRPPYQPPYTPPTPTAYDYGKSADAAFDAKRWDSAITNYSKFIEMQPGVWQAYVRRADAYLFTDKYDQALADYNKAMSLKPDEASGCLRNRGACRLKKGQVDLAVADLSKAVEAKSDDGWAYWFRSEAYARQDKLDMALADRAKAVELLPGETAVCERCARIYGLQKKYDLAIADWSRIITEKPDVGVAYYFRAQNYADQGKLTLALDDLDKAETLSPSDPDVYDLRGRIRMAKKQFDQAIVDFGKAIDVKSDYGPAFLHRGMVYAAQGKLDLSIRDYDTAVTMMPKLPAAYYYRASGYGSKGELQKAIEDYGRAIDLDPKMAAAYNDRGWAIVRAGDYKKALGDLDRAIELDPQPTYYDSRAMAYFHLNEFEKAEADATTAARLDPKFAWIRATGFRIKCATDKVADGVNELEATIRVLPSDDRVVPVLQYFLGKVSLDDLKTKHSDMWGTYEVVVRGYGPEDVRAATVGVRRAELPIEGGVSCDLRIVSVADGSVDASATGEAKTKELQALAKALSKKFKEKTLVKGETVAIITFRNRAETKRGRTVADELADKVAGALVDQGWFDVKERIDLRAVMDEKDLESADIVKNPSVQKKLSGVKYVIIGGVTLSDSKSD